MTVSYRDMPKLTSSEATELIGKQPVKGYPPRENRLQYKPEVWRQLLNDARKHDNRIDIPDGGPHFADTYGAATRMRRSSEMDVIVTREQPLPEKRVAEWRKLGLLVDTTGRPLHPRAEQVLTHPKIGMYTGPGKYYRYGPQRIGNLILQRIEQRQYNELITYAIVGVRRNGEIEYSVPGGHCELGKNTQDTAFREAKEEAGIVRASLGKLQLQEVISWPKGGKADTLHAWGEEWFTFARSTDNPALEGVELQPDSKEAVTAEWRTFEEIRKLLAEDRFIKTHFKIIQHFHQQSVR